jgi:hypothetical protein
MNDLESLVTCPICSNTMCEPTTMQCGHSFCRSCTIKWCFEYKHYNCPVCRKELDKSLPNVNVSLKSIIYLMETNHIETNFNKDKNFSKLFWSLFSLSSSSSSSSNNEIKKEQQLLDHAGLMRKVAINLEEEVEDYDCWNDEKRNDYSNLNETFKSMTRRGDDNTLSRLKIFKFPFYLFFSLFGLMAMFFLRKLRISS